METMHDGIDFHSRMATEGSFDDKGGNFDGNVTKANFDSNRRELRWQRREFRSRSDEGYFRWQQKGISMEAERNFDGIIPEAGYFW